MKYVFITHWDLDAAGAYIIANQLYDIIEYKAQGYGKLEKNANQLIEKHGNGEVGIVIADLCMEEDLLRKLCDNFPKVIFFDHHQESSTYEELQHVIENLEVHYEDNRCSTSLIYKEWIKAPTRGIRDYMEFVALVEVYDNWRTYSTRWSHAYGLNELFWKYSLFRFVKIFSDGRSDFNADEIDYIEEIRAKKLKALDDAPSKELSTGSLILLVDNEGVNFVNDVTLELEPNIFYMLWRKDDKWTGSMRASLNDNINLGAVISTFSLEEDGITGGGHPFAGGLEFPADAEIKTIENRIEEFDKKVRQKAGL